MSTFNPTKFDAIFFFYFVEWNLTTCDTKLNLAGAPTNFVRWKFNIFFVSFFLFFIEFFFNGFQNKKFFLLLRKRSLEEQKEKNLLKNENVIR